MARGKIKKWLADRKIGWIIDDADEAEVFFGDRSLQGLRPEDIRPGLEVDFDRRQENRGPAARNVRPVGTVFLPQISPSEPPRSRPGGAAGPTRGRAIPEPPSEIPLPRSTQVAFGKVPVRERHPGLCLDKYLKPCPQQEQQRDVLADLASLPGNSELLAEFLGTRRITLETLGARTWSRTTAGPLTLHLARASALENAGICFHPLFGFVYFPGSGLKGMTRAYAETVWLPTRENKKEAWAEIEAVFGWAPGSDLIAPGETKPWKPKQIEAHGKEDAAQSGWIVFHDAWPSSWPRLLVDIVNNHHPIYYQEGQPPGDWDSPVPVYFLAVPPGTEFQFALGKLREDVPDRLLTLAQEWLDGALTHLGCGAKTVAGYGYFRSVGSASTLLPSAAVAECSATLTLNGPAFLAGADQQAEDCDLRPATLRGLLRWWWRTLFSGYLTTAELASLEADLWGNTTQGGAIRIRLETLHRAGSHLFNFKDGFNPKAAFKRQHGLGDRPDNKTTQGLFYSSFGMDEMSRGVPRQRFFLETGSSWRIVLSTRAATKLSPGEVLDQARAALWLLCRFGGCGSKSRKGFGSLRLQWDVPLTQSLEACRKIASTLRDKLFPDSSFHLGRAETPALDDPNCVMGEIASPWTDPWQLLDAIGFVYQSFAQLHKHDPAKAALGLPRKIHGPRPDGPIRTRDGRSMQDEEKYRPPVWLDFPRRPAKVRPENARYASPFHVHLDLGEQGTLLARFIAFPSPVLRTREESENMLNALMKHCLEGLPEKWATGTRRAPVPPTTSSATGSSGGKVQVKVLEPHSAGGRSGFKVQEEGKPPGLLLYGTPPQTLPRPGDTIQVYRNNNDLRSPQYRWDPLPPPAPPRGNRGPGRPRR